MTHSIIKRHNVFLLIMYLFDLFERFLSVFQISAVEACRTATGWGNGRKRCCTQSGTLEILQGKVDNVTIAWQERIPVDVENFASEEKIGPALHFECLTGKNTEFAPTDFSWRMKVGCLVPAFMK